MSGKREMVSQFYCVFGVRREPERTTWVYDADGRATRIDGLDRETIAEVRGVLLTRAAIREARRHLRDIGCAVRVVRYRIFARSR